MIRCRLQLLLASVTLAICCSSAAGQNYSFRVPTMQMEVFAEPDASVRIVYDITFINNRGAHPIDVVDIGVLHANYRLDDVRASIGGKPRTDIRPSEYVQGFEVHLHEETIPAGGQGTLHVEFMMPNMVYEDTTRSDYASLRITPTWFGEQFVVGMTHLQVAIQLPKSVQPDEVLHQGLNFTEKAATPDGARVGWDWPATRLTGKHMVAVSFPRRDLDRVVVKSKLDMLVEWFANSPVARAIAGVVLVMLFAFAFFRFTGSTGCSVFGVLTVVLIVVMVASPGWHLVLLPLAVVLVGVNEWFLAHRKTSYMPPIAQVEGGGIKRGLTAPEAAVLLEMPVAKILSLVVFGMLKKGLVHQTSADPLCVDVDADFRLDDRGRPAIKEQYKFYRNAGKKKGVVVHKYEHGFLYLLESNPGKPVQEIDFHVPMKKLIERVVARMKGFDLSDTKDYYRSIIRQACQQAAAIGDIQQREKTIDRHFEWILMDDDYPTVFTGRRAYYPVWTRGMTTAPGSPAQSIPMPGTSSANQTSFGDVSASFAGWAENTMGNMASAIAPNSLSAARPTGGFINLGGVDKVTGEFFQALAEASSSGGGGGGGGCACACAGCACACACAGGGR